MRLFSFVVAVGLIMSKAEASYVSSLPQYAQELFTESMAWMDTFYDPQAGYLYDLSAQTALDHETRSSSWYALGLLARNQDDDVKQAEKVVNNIVSGQFRNESQQWYHHFPVRRAILTESGMETIRSSQKNRLWEVQLTNNPSTVAGIQTGEGKSWVLRRCPTRYGGMERPPGLYFQVYFSSSLLVNLTSPRFVGTTFVMILEEFGSLLGASTVSAIHQSLYVTSVGDSYRVGGVDDDNLYPSYSNPAIMRAFVSTYVGQQQNDTNMTRAGENEAQEIIDLFERANTLSEFNSGTYTGVSLFALTLWVKYLPEDHFMHQRGRLMIEETWKAVGELWHADLKNMAGPWDRAYGFDMKRYLSLLALWFWTIVGKEAAGLVRYVGSFILH
jgi:hypothetical protein